MRVAKMFICLQMKWTEYNSMAEARICRALRWNWTYLHLYIILGWRNCRIFKLKALDTASILPQIEGDVRDCMAARKKHPSTRENLRIRDLWGMVRNFVDMEAIKAVAQPAVSCEMFMMSEPWVPFVCVCIFFFSRFQFSLMILLQLDHCV